MSSVSSASPGLENLLQTLSNVDSPALSSPSVVAALQNAPPSDIVQLSTAALQLEGIDALFGVSRNSGSEAIVPDLDGILAPSTPSASIAAPTSSSAVAASGAAATASSPQQVAAYESALEADATAALFGDGSGGNTIDSLFDISG
jgi:hypothetical protein